MFLVIHICRRQLFLFLLPGSFQLLKSLFAHLCQRELHAHQFPIIIRHENLLFRTLSVVFQLQMHSGFRIAVIKHIIVPVFLPLQFLIQLLCQADALEARCRSADTASVIASPVQRNRLSMVVLSRKQLVDQPVCQCDLSRLLILPVYDLRQLYPVTAALDKHHIFLLQIFSVCRRKLDLVLRKMGFTLHCFSGKIPVRIPVQIRQCLYDILQSLHHGLQPYRALDIPVLSVDFQLKTGNSCLL